MKLVKTKGILASSNLFVSFQYKVSTKNEKGCVRDNGQEVKFLVYEISQEGWSGWGIY